MISLEAKECGHVTKQKRMDGLVRFAQLGNHTTVSSRRGQVCIMRTRPDHLKATVRELVYFIFVKGKEVREAVSRRTTTSFTGHIVFFFSSKERNFWELGIRVTFAHAKVFKIKRQDNKYLDETCLTCLEEEQPLEQPRPSSCFYLVGKRH